MMRWHLPFQINRGDALLLGRAGTLPFSYTVRVPAAQRSTHMYVLGITGQGKSKLLQQCLFQDIMAGRGCGVLDPHSDLAGDLLMQLTASGFFKSPANRARVIFFDPARTDYFIPFNVLETGNAPYTTAINVIEAFRRTWPESLREAPRFTNILLASLLVLIANDLTLVELPRLLTDRAFRETLLATIDDSELVSVFHHRLDRWGRQEPLFLESILNKVSALALNPMLRVILGHGENSLNFRKIMDEGRVLIVDLGRCDSETRRLLGSLVVTSMEQAALSRKDEPTRLRRPFYFYIDEFQDFCASEASTMTLSHILSESRKFGLHLTLAHQTLGQMTNERLLSALGNIGTKVVFAVDRVDAEIMAKKLFSVDAMQVKHEVEDEVHQEKSHPVYYSLPEQWEQAIQHIQSLRPRACVVKRPSQHAVTIRTTSIAAHAIPDSAMEQLRRSLVIIAGRPVVAATLGRRPTDGQKDLFNLDYYEPIK